VHLFVAANERITSWLVVVWNMFYLSHHIGNFIIPTDEVHHFSEGLVETTNQIVIVIVNGD